MNRTGRRTRLIRMAGGWAVGVMMLCSAGCALFGVREPAPVTVPKILEMSRSGTPADQIVDTMRASGTVYRLKASQLAELRNEGVPDDVIDYMQQTYLDAVQRDASYEEWDRWNRFGGYWYGGAPFGWPYQRVYIIREQPKAEHH